MRARPLLLASGVLLASLTDLGLRGRDAIEVVDTNLGNPPASSGTRVVDLVRPSPPARALDLSFSSSVPPPRGARLEVALASAGRTRILAIRPGHPVPSVAGALRDLASGGAVLRIVPDRGWLDLGPVRDGNLEVQVFGLLPGPFGLETPLSARAGARGDIILKPPGPEDPGTRPRWRLVVPRPVAPAETLARVFFFVRHSAVLATAGLLALGLFAGGTVLLFSGRAWGGTVALVGAATLLHAVLLPPLQGADETSHAATIEAIVFRGSPPRPGDLYPGSFSLVARTLEQDRIQFQPSEPLPLRDGVERSRIAGVLARGLTAEALEGGPEPPAAFLDPPDRRSPLFFRAYGLVAAFLRDLPFLDRVSSYRILASCWALVLTAAGALILRRAGVSDQVAALYGLTALLPYSVATAGTCSNYAPAIGLGQLLAAAAAAAVLSGDRIAKRAAAATFVLGSWIGVFLWTDFAFPAILATLILGYSVGVGLSERAGLPPRAARLAAGATMLSIGAAGSLALLRLGAEGSLAVQIPGRLGSVGIGTGAFMGLLALAPPLAGVAAAFALRRLEKMPPAESRATLVSVSLALVALATCAFLLTAWTAVPYEREWLTFPRLVVAHLRAFVSNALAWDQDRLTWKFWFGAFGWHDAFYPDAVYALARWGLVSLFVAFPVVATPFVLKRPRAARALLMLSGAALGCGVLTFALRYLLPTVPYGRFLLPLFPLAAFPLLVMLEAEGRERWLRAALFLAAALQVWTALAVVPSRYAFAT